MNSTGVQKNCASTPELGVPWETVQAELHDRLKSRKA